MALEVHGDIEFSISQQSSNVGIASGTHIVESIERLLQPGTHGALVVAAKGECRNLKPRSVMMFDEPGNQFGGGVLAEIARQVGDADALPAIGLDRPKRRNGRRYAILDELFRANPPQCGVVAEGQKGKWRDDCAAIGHRVDDLVLILRPTGEIAPPQY